MGVDPLTLGIIGSAGASLYGAISGNRAQQQSANAGQQRYNQLSGLVQGQMQQGQNPYAQAITQMFGGSQGGGGFQLPVSTYQPASASLASGPQGFDILSQAGYNAGQDGLAQMMRRQLTPTQNPDLALNLQRQAGGASFDNSQLFQALQSQNQFNTDQQVGALRAQARSLGQLGGTAMMNAEGNLRAQLANNAAVQNAQLASSSFENAQNRSLQAAGIQAGQEQAGNQFSLGAYGAQTGAAQSYLQAALQAAGIAMQPGLQQQQLGTQVGLSNAAGQNAAGQFNAGQQNQMGLSQQQLILQALMGAGGLQGQQQGQNAQLLGILGGIGMPGYPQSQIPGAVGDISQLAMLYPFLRQMQGGAGGGGGAMGNIAAMPFGVLGGIGGNIPIPTSPNFSMGWNGFGGGGF